MNSPSLKTNTADKHPEHRPLEGTGRDEREQAYARGFRIFKQGRYRQALAHFSDLLCLEPANPRYLAAMGACFQRLHRYEDALRQYALSILIAPNQRLCQLYSAQCLLALGRTADAAKALSILLQTPPAERTEARASNDRALEAYARAMLDAIEGNVDQARPPVAPF